MSAMPNSSSQGSPSGSSGMSIWDFLVGPIGYELGWGKDLEQGVGVVEDKVVKTGTAAAAWTANEAASAYDWGKAAVTDIAGTTKKSITDTLGLFDAGVHAATDTVNSYGDVAKGAGMAAMGVGSIFLIGGIVLAMYLFSRRDTILEHAASGAGAAGAAAAAGA